MACARGSIRLFRKRPSGFKASPTSGDARTTHVTRPLSTRDTDSDPLSESQKDISTFGSSSRANAPPACMYSSGEPAGTEKLDASWVPAIASGTTSSNQTTAAFSASDQNGGLERMVDLIMGDPEKQSNAARLPAPQRRTSTGVSNT